MGDISDIFVSTHVAQDATCSEIGVKLDICMLVDIPYRNGTVELGSASRNGIITYLTNFGHSVTWVVPAENISELQRLRLGNVHVFATPYTYFFNNSSLIGKTVNVVLNTKKRIRSILKIFGQGNYNIMYVKGDMLDGLIAIYIKRKYGVPFVFDSEPLGMVWEVNKIKSKWPRFLPYLIAKIHDWITMYQIKKADLITPSSKWFGDVLAQRGIREDKLMPYPNGIDVAAFTNKDGRDIREQYQLVDSQIVIYVGNLDKVRRLSVLIRAFSRVRKHKGQVKLLMLGEGSDRRTLEELARELEIQEDVIFTGQVPASQIPKFIAAADIGISPVSPVACHIIGSPLKMFEYMGGGKPVIANEEILDQKEVVEQSGGGILVPFTSEAFAAAMIELLDNPQMVIEMGQRGRKWVAENRSYEVLARQVEKRLCDLVLTHAKTGTT